MLFKDIDIFVTAAQAILRGLDPYSLSNVEVFYPLPFYFIFIPFAALPLPLVHALWGGLQTIVLVVILRRRALAVALSIPVLIAFIFGQVDILTLGLFALLRTGVAGGVALAFLVLKPQLVLLLAPWVTWRWWLHDRRQLVWFAAIAGLILILSLFVQPDWVANFLGRSSARMRGGISSSLWGLLSFLPTPLWIATGLLLTLGAIIYAWRSNDFDIVTAVGLLISPFIFSYNLVPLTLMLRDSRLLLGFAALSWITFSVAALQSNDGASALLTLAVLLVLIIQK